MSIAPMRPATSDGPPPRLQSRLADLPRYRAGAAVGPGGETAGLARLASNELPFPPLPGVRAAVARAAATAGRYADPHAGAAVAALAERYGCDPADVVVGTGSSALLMQLALATCGPGDEVLMPWRSFEFYPIVTGVAGARAVTVPLAPGGRIDLDALARAVTPRTRLVLVCSPNNPTGTTVGAQALQRFLDRIPSDVVVALDEAYGEFVRDPDAAHGPSARRGRGNLVVLRTFSKAYGLAGLRIGYALADPRVAEALRAVAVPFSVSGPAQAAALASLAAPQALAARVEQVIAERGRLAAGLVDAGLPVVAGEGNFVWLPVGTGSAALAEGMAARGVLVRPFGDDGVRITVGSTADTRRVLAATAG